jgi:hypothetical protein
MRQPNGPESYAAKEQPSSFRMETPDRDIGRPEMAHKDQRNDP